MSNDIHRASEMETGLDAALLEDRKPLVVRGLQIIPSATNHFKKTDNVVIYTELYAPVLLSPNPPKVGVEMRVTDRTAGQTKLDVQAAATEVQAGNPVVPLGLKVPVTSLAPGSYRVELRGLDTLGGNTSFRSADFEVE